MEKLVREKSGAGSAGMQKRGRLKIEVDGNSQLQLPPLRLLLSKLMTWLKLCFAATRRALDTKKNSVI